MLEECYRRNFPDMEHIHDVCHWGLGNRARGPRNTWLCPNYRPFYEPANYAFVQEQMSKKRRRVPRKLSAALPVPHTIPAYACPTSCNVRWHDEKQRVIKDFGGTRRMGILGLPDFEGKTDESSPASVNGRTDIDNLFDFPSIVYMSMQVVVRAAAILRTVELFVVGEVPPGLRVHQWATDFCAWYEQIPRTSAEDWCQHQFVSACMWETDPMLIFGGSSCVAGAQRIEGAVAYCATERVQEAADALLWRSAVSPAARARLTAMRVPRLPNTAAVRACPIRRLLPVGAEAAGLGADGRILPEVLMPLLAWMEHRWAAGVRSPWFVVGGMIDDTACFGFEFLHLTAQRAIFALCSDWGLEVADGGLQPDGVTRRKQKTQSEPASGSMVLLGLLPCILAGSMAADPAKRKRFDKALREVQAAPVVARERDTGRWVPVESVRRLFGQLQNIVVFVFPNLRASLAAVRSLVQVDVPQNVPVPLLSAEGTGTVVWRRSDARRQAGELEACWLPQHAQARLERLAVEVFGPCRAAKDANFQEKSQNSAAPETGCARPLPPSAGPLPGPSSALAPPLSGLATNLQEPSRPRSLPAAAAAAARSLGQCEPEPGEREPPPLGTAFVPRGGQVGKNGRGRLCQWYDASGDHAVGFRGWGVITWLEGSDVVLVSQGPFSHNARLELHSSALEAATGTEAELLSVPTLQWAKADLQQVGDNSSAADGADSSVMHSAVMRAALAVRECVRSTLPREACVVSVHVKRGRNAPADWLTHNDYRLAKNDSACSGVCTCAAKSRCVTWFEHELCVLLQRDVRVCWQDPAPGFETRLLPLLRVAAREKERLRQETQARARGRVCLHPSLQLPAPPPVIPVWRDFAWHVQAVAGAAAAAGHGRGAAAGGDCASPLGAQGERRQAQKRAACWQGPWQARAGPWPD